MHVRASRRSEQPRNIISSYHPSQTTFGAGRSIPAHPSCTPPQFIIIREHHRLCPKAAKKNHAPGQKQTNQQTTKEHPIDQSVSTLPALSMMVDPSSERLSFENVYSLNYRRTNPHRHRHLAAPVRHRRLRVEILCSRASARRLLSLPHLADQQQDLPHLPCGLRMGF